MDDFKISLYEEEVYRREEAREETVSLVVFRLLKEWFGVAVMSAREVVTVESITFLPSAPAFVSGIINLRGNMLAVTDLKVIFNLPQSELTQDSRVVVVVNGSYETGLLVDEVAEISDVFLSKIEPPLATVPNSLAQYFKGEYRDNDRLVAILNVEKILEKGQL